MAENKNEIQNQNSSGEREDYLKISLVNQGIAIKKNRNDPLMDLPDEEIDYKNIDLLNRYITERGKIMASRITGISLKKQRKLSKAIKRARNLALLSFVSKTGE